MPREVRKKAKYRYGDLKPEDWTIVEAIKWGNESRKFLEELKRTGKAERGRYDTTFCNVNHAFEQHRLPYRLHKITNLARGISTITIGKRLES